MIKMKAREKHKFFTHHVDVHKKPKEELMGIFSMDKGLKIFPWVLSVLDLNLNPEYNLVFFTLLPL